MISKPTLMVTCAMGALVASSPAFAQSPQQQEREREEARQQAEEPADDENPEDFGGATPRTERGPGSPAPGDRNEVVVETITVTGDRWEELLDEAIAVTLFSAEERNLVSAGTARQMVDLTPGFTFTETFGLNVRGVGRQTPQTLLGQENTVTQYVNGFLNIVPFNIAESTLFGGNVQFLRGPQGTRYGRNAIAGAVNLIARSPTPEVRGEAVAGIGRGGWWNVGVNVAGPLSDNFGIRVGAQKFYAPSTRDNIGSADDAGLAINNLYLELQLEGNIDRFHFLTRSTHFDYRNQPDYTSPAVYNTGVVFGGLGPNPQYRYEVPSPTEPFTINVDFAGFDALNDNMQHILNADYDFDFAKLYYVGGYQQYTALGAGDLDLTSRRSFTTRPGEPFIVGTIVPTFYTYNYFNVVYYYSHELRLESSDQGSPLQWIVGAYYLNMDFDESYWEAIPDAALLATPTANAPGATTAPNPRRATYQQRNIYDIRSTAVFGNVTYNLTPELSFEGGLRYTWDEKDALTDFRYVFFYPPAFAGDVTPLIHGARTFRRDDDWSGRAAVIYRPTPGSEFYGSYARGYKASAFTLGQGLPPNNVAEDEHLDVYELGATWTFPNRFRVYGAAFYMNYHDMQIPISTRAANAAGLPLGPVFSRFVNAENARIWGVELETSWAPVDNSMIALTYTFLDAEFTDFCPVIPNTNPPACGVVDISQPVALRVPEDLSGNRIPRAPRHKLALHGYYAFDMGRSGSIIPGWSVAWQDEMFANAFNRPQFILDDYVVANFTLTYRTDDNRFDLVASVTNAFREIYPQNVAVSVIGGQIARTEVLAPDRFYSLTGRFRF